ncbi:hypothetical protein ASPCADRAFT_7632 [Aspergillus carbonarius ITEM 5010]|uniref:Transcription factor domain-containing protein n=1 Tax=Aspergillus carbonarius (strain ITEM 5010) TaxID=602072 RepID=A0A1R3RG02_ASPC5|nr:hypothetical protein ASPCADRAFT_7632 [Aspergillus carbonarius ITEM 5010]
MERTCVFQDNTSRNKIIRNSRIDQLQRQVNKLAAQVSVREENNIQAVPQEGPKSKTSLTTYNCFPDNRLLERQDDFISQGLLTVIEANELLIKFRTHVMPLFPFVIIPDEDLPTLRQNSPFLLLYLITASLENNPPLQQRMETEVRKTIATRLILNMERNMDLLLGLLVHIAWCHYYWRTYHTQVYMFLQIAMMVVVDVGLDKYENFRMQRIAQDAHPSQKKEWPP